MLTYSHFRFGYCPSHHCWLVVPSTRISTSTVSTIYRQKLRHLSVCYAYTSLQQILFYEHVPAGTKVILVYTYAPYEKSVYIDNKPIGVNKWYKCTRTSSFPPPFLPNTGSFQWSISNDSLYPYMNCKRQFSSFQFVYLYPCDLRESPQIAFQFANNAFEPYETSTCVYITNALEIVFINKIF